MDHGDIDDFADRHGAKQAFDADTFMLCTRGDDRRVEPAMISAPTPGAMVRSTNVCSSVPGSQVTKIMRDPALRARVSAPRTNRVIPLADTPMTTSFFDVFSRAIARAPSS